MAEVFINQSNLFNLTVKATPTTADFIPLGDSATTGVPMVQATVGSLPGVSIPVVTKTTNYNVLASDFGKFLNFTGFGNLNLPTALLPSAVTVGNGWYVTIGNSHKLINGLSDFSVGIAASAGNINGGSDIRLYTNQVCTIVSDGTDYWTTTQLTPPLEYLDGSIKFYLAAMPGQISSVQSNTQTQSALGTLLNGKILFFPFVTNQTVPSPIKLTVPCEVGVAAGELTVGIFSTAYGLDDFPQDPVLATSTITVTAAGAKTSGNMNVTLTPNTTYFLAITANDSATLSLGCWLPNLVGGIIGLSIDSTGVFPWVGFYGTHAYVSGVLPTVLSLEPLIAYGGSPAMYLPSIVLQLSS